jgi:predicted metal-dependent peptidase
MINTMRDTTKQPIIRPGQRKPYVKATRKEVQQRLKAVAVLDDSGWETSSIYWFFQEVFGIESRQIARYIAHARARETA